MCQCQGNGTGPGQHQHKHHHQHQRHHQQGQSGQCGCGHQVQELTPQEQLIKLKLYAERLQNEIQAVDQRIKELEAKD